MPRHLEVIAAGAVHAYFDELQSSAALADFALNIAFAPAGAITDKVRSGTVCDVVISSSGSLDTLAGLGLVRTDSITPIGATEVAVCTRDGNATPRIEDEAALPALLLSATSIHIPDIASSTAGAHMGLVIERLGLRNAISAKLHTHANGNATMRAVAESIDRSPLGFTQRSEIVSAAGTLLGDPLPGRFRLSTTYGAGIARNSTAAEQVQQFIDFLCSEEQQEVRGMFGFFSGK